VSHPEPQTPPHHTVSILALDGHAKADFA